jgi:hypothetical protein
LRPWTGKAMVREGSTGGNVIYLLHICTSSRCRRPQAHTFPARTGNADAVCGEKEGNGRYTSSQTKTIQTVSLPGMALELLYNTAYDHAAAAKAIFRLATAKGTRPYTSIPIRVRPRHAALADRTPAAQYICIRRNILAYAFSLEW